MASAPSVVVLDYGSGNVHSAAKALEAAGARVELTADRDRVSAADGLVVPGVGAFAAVMAGLDAVRGGELIGRRLAGGRPVGHSPRRPHERAGDAHPAGSLGRRRGLSLKAHGRLTVGSRSAGAR